MHRRILEQAVKTNGEASAMRNFVQKEVDNTRTHSIQATLHSFTSLETKLALSFFCIS